MTIHKERLSGEDFEIKRVTERGKKQKVVVMGLRQNDPIKPPLSNETLEDLLKTVREAPRNPKLYRGRHRF